MQRRDLRRGARDARDRARHRGRHLRTRTASEPREELGSHLAQLDLSAPTQVDTDAYARATAHIDLPLGERLRQLAIELECSRGVQGWSVLEPIYDAALAADPELADTWSSRALAYWRTHPDSARAFATCLPMARRSTSLNPTDGHNHSILGMLLYQARELEDAEHILRRAIALGRRGWPHVWLAHTLHDQRHWAEAADAYDHIPAEALPPTAAWRVQLARQQRASCQLRAGQKAEAIATYAEVLTRYERALDAGLPAHASPVLAAGPPEYLFDDVGSLPELQGRVAALRARLEHHPDLSLHPAEP